MRLEVRGIGPAIIRGYLKDLGAVESAAGTASTEPALSLSKDSERRLVGDGWSATVEAGEPISIGALRIGVTIVTFVGDEATLQRVVADLERKTLRAGG